MTTSTSTFPLAAATQASWQAQIDSIHAVMLAAGWTQTADTGQVVNAPAYSTTVGVSQGYRVYKWSDSLASTLGSLYAKVTFVTHQLYNGSSYIWMLLPRIEVSLGTDGAGNLASPSVMVADVDSGSAGGSPNVGRRGNYASYGSSYSIALFGAEHNTWTPAAANTNKIFPSGYPAIANCIGMLAVRRLTDSAGTAVAGFSVIAHGNVAGPSSAWITHRLTSARLMAGSSMLYGGEVVPSLAQSNLLVPVALTPAVQRVNPMAVSSDGALVPFQELAFYYGSASFTLDQSFTNRIAGVDRTFRALGNIGLYPYLVDARSSSTFSSADWADKDARCCLSIRWE